MSKQVSKIGAVDVSCLSAFTRAALDNARRMGLDGGMAVAAVLDLNRRSFLKSMTTHHDHRVWQDVYHYRLSDGRWAYIKLTLRDGAVVIQFKEK